MSKKRKKIARQSHFLQHILEPHPSSSTSPTARPTSWYTNQEVYDATSDFAPAKLHWSNLKCESRMRESHHCFAVQQVSGKGHIEGSGSDEGQGLICRPKLIRAQRPLIGYRPRVLVNRYSHVKGRCDELLAPSVGMDNGCVNSDCHDRANSQTGLEATVLRPARHLRDICTLARVALVVRTQSSPIWVEREADVARAKSWIF